MKFQMPTAQQSFEQEFPNLDFAKFNDLCDSFSLRAKRRCMLAYRLHQTGIRYGVHRTFVEVPMPSAVRNFLQVSIQNPLNRIGKVAKEMAREEEALAAQKNESKKGPRPSRNLRYFTMMKSMIGHSFEKWAHKQDSSTLQSMGIDHGQLYVAVDRWFDMSILMMERLEESEQHLARLKPGRSKPRLGGDDRDGAKRYLCGTLLKKVYENYTGDECVVLKDTVDREVLDEGGVKFIKLCHEAMKLGSITVSTIRNHLDPPRKAGKPIKKLAKA